MCSKAAGCMMLCTPCITLTPLPMKKTLTARDERPHEPLAPVPVVVLGVRRLGGRVYADVEQALVDDVRHGGTASASMADEPVTATRRLAQKYRRRWVHCTFTA